MDLKRPLIIAGPCSAESEQQVLATAQALAATGKVDILRAGVWKPRTKPGSFEGAGVEALPWLIKARELTGLPIATEVANAKHVERALEYDVDVLWIGARTAANPFSMQEVAEALRAEYPDIPSYPTQEEGKVKLAAGWLIDKAGMKEINFILKQFRFQ